jgi:4-hydroxy-tetrahydrodipicolinate reductase
MRLEDAAGVRERSVAFLRGCAPLYRQPSRRDLHVRHAADRGWRRRAHGAHADPRHRRDRWSHPRGCGGGSFLRGDRPRNGVTVATEIGPLLAHADGLVDFTVPAATVAFAEHTARTGCAHVIGTTGLTGESEALIAEAAKRAVIVKSGNMSMGVNLLAALVKRVAQTLDEDFDVEILEMHHNRKIDAPSGTALMLGRAAAQGRGVNLEQHSVRGRNGTTGARCPGDIGFASLRGGSVVGEHTVVFAGPAERLELTHKAEDRMIFARGALRAALWARGRKPGLYSMADVLGLSDA